MDVSKEEFMQAVSIVKMWCYEHMNEPCECPFREGYRCSLNHPFMWNLGEKTKDNECRYKQ